MTILASIVFAVWALGAQGRATPPADDLTAAKALYAQGIYEEALAKLGTIRGESTADEVDQYRALCLLALGRTLESQRALESLFTRTPLFKMSDADVPPRLITMFHDVRRRLLPVAVRGLYAKAKANYDKKNFAAAIAQFKDVVTLSNDDDLGDEAAALADLKMLGEGFLVVAQAELDKAAAAAAKAAAAAPPPDPDPPAATAPPKPAAATPEVPQGPRVYTEADKDVTAPIEVQKALPEWNPANPQWRKFELSGAIRIVIDETGKVESATLVKSVHESYDPLLLAAARQWLYRPARRNGLPVKYQKLVAVLLSPR